MTKILKKIKQLLKRYIPLFRHSTPKGVSFNTLLWGKQNIEELIVDCKIPEVIWIYWENDTIDSPTVGVCLQRIKELHPGFIINVLNKKNIGDYISTSLEVVYNETLPAANKSDWIRLKLLQLYGGIYIDASVLLMEDLNWVCKLNETHLTEAIVYYTESNTTDISYPIIETWMIGAKPQSKFINDWLTEYENCLNSTHPGIYYTKSPHFDYRTIPLDVDYYKCYFSVQSVIRRSSDYRVLLVCADYDAYLYALQVKPKWSNIALSEILLLNKKSQNLPKLVKIISGSRKTLDENILLKNYKCDSVLGELIYKYKLYEIY